MKQSRRLVSVTTTISIVNSERQQKCSVYPEYELPPWFLYNFTETVRKWIRGGCTSRRQNDVPAIFRQNHFLQWEDTCVLMVAERPTYHLKLKFSVCVKLVSLFSSSYSFVATILKWICTHIYNKWLFLVRIRQSFYYDFYLCIVSLYLSEAFAWWSVVAFAS